MVEDELNKLNKNVCRAKFLKKSFPVVLDDRATEIGSSSILFTLVLVLWQSFIHFNPPPASRTPLSKWSHAFLCVVGLF